MTMLKLLQSITKMMALISEKGEEKTRKKIVYKIKYLKSMACWVEKEHYFRQWHAGLRKNTTSVNGTLG